LNNDLEKNRRQPIGDLVPSATPARISDNELSELKADLALAIIKIMEDRKLTLSHTARLIGTDPAKICAILHGRLKGMSVERLIRYACLLGNDVEISILRRKRGRVGIAKIIQPATASLARL
jgi:hypothetical protein